MSQRILIVDDESSLRTALFRILERRGFQVVTAGSKAEAEKLCNSQHAIDLALIDLRLPDGDGRARHDRFESGRLPGWL